MGRWHVFAAILVITLSTMFGFSANKIIWLGKGTLFTIDPAFEPDDYPETKELLAAIAMTDKSRALAFANSLLGRDLSNYGNPIYANFVKTLAFRLRAEAKKSLNFESDQIVADIKHAADLGSIDADLEMIDALREAEGHGQKLLGSTITPDSIYPYALFAARMGHCDAIRFLTLDNPTLPGQLDIDNAIFWKLNADLNCTSEFRNGVQEFLKDVFIFGSEKVIHSLMACSPVGGPFDSIYNDLPGRGILATFAAVFVQSREKYFHSTKIMFDRHKAESRPRRTIEEEFGDWSKISTGPTALYLLTPYEPKKHDNRHIVHMELEEVLRQLRSGDGVYARCGPLAHYAVVDAIERDKGTIEFSDSLYQFWQPSHDDCISSMRLISGRPGEYLTKINIQELAPMIEAVLTLRSSQTSPWEEIERYISDLKSFKE